MFHTEINVIDDHENEVVSVSQGANDDVWSTWVSFCSPLFTTKVWGNQLWVHNCICEEVQVNETTSTVTISGKTIFLLVGCKSQE